jgi:hypothetical protein
MTEAIRELSNWYPLLPSGSSVPTVAANLLDMHVIVPLPAKSYASQLNGTGLDMCAAYLVSVTSSTVSVAARMCDGSTIQVTATVYVGRDAVPAPGESYAVFAAQPASASGLSLQVHPDCLRFMQTAPQPTFMLRGNVMSDDATPDGQGGRINGSTGAPQPAVMSPLSFEDGNNVSVSVADDILVFTGASGAGTGQWTESPYVDTVMFPTSPGKGLRSINGQTGDVVLEGSEVVDVSVDYDDTLTDKRVLTVRLKPLE